MHKHVWALDFDGVVCDSVGESSLTAWKAAERLWPAVFTSQTAVQARPKVLEQMRVVRPVVETGYENIPQIRCLLEGIKVPDILSRWHTILEEHMAKWGLERQQMVALFGSTRDDWIAKDLAGWLAPNRIYPGVAEALQRALQQEEVYIVTTKQARFTEMLLHNMAEVLFPPERIFSQTESGAPKSVVLERLQAKHPSTTYHFVEDKLATLEKVCQVPQLANWKLYLVDWGYNTPEERKRAHSNSRIEVVDMDRFTALLDGAAYGAT
ncbi:hypothetical protein WJX72_006066 [[Myrmecia] bisecta]|uniref:Uncharacterized protein n=1 Tax=[Myrmecia] bisecta TaxID=41462 RepID=A0AAW1Q432_9CHLO